MINQSMVDLSQDIQDEIFAAAYPYLQKGRPQWDIPHTKACMYWMKELIKHEGGNPRVLLPAIILHDIGYNEPGAIENKTEHMRLGAEIAKQILLNFSFTEEERAQIIHLVGMHDDLTKVHSHEEQLVFEADSLGQIDCEKVEPTATGEWRQKFLDYFVKNRIPLFKTQHGKKALAHIWPMALAWK